MSNKNNIYIKHNTNTKNQKPKETHEKSKPKPFETLNPVNTSALSSPSRCTGDTNHQQQWRATQPTPLPFLFLCFSSSFLPFWLFWPQLRSPECNRPAGASPWSLSSSPSPLSCFISFGKEHFWGRFKVVWSCFGSTV